MPMFNNAAGAGLAAPDAASPHASAFNQGLDGDDFLLGGDGPESLHGGAGDDTIDGGHGDDLLSGDSGDDLLIWSPGGGSDRVDGGSGFDTSQFIGANLAEAFTIAADGRDVSLLRNLGSIDMDISHVERLLIQTFNGADTIAVNDLGGTDVQVVDIDLAGATTADDGAADTVTVNATAAAETIQLSVANGVATVSGLGEVVNVAHAGVGDRIVIEAGDGADTVTGGAFPAQVVLDGGAGNDLLLGPSGADTLDGGQGDDTLDGGVGADLMRGGDGDDLLIWRPGEGSDTLDGGAGFDTHQFFGAGGAEVFNIFASGAHAILTRNLGGINMDLVGVERIELKALGGADSVTVGALTGTGVTQLDLDLGAGDDTLNASAAAGAQLTVAGGDGNDLFVFRSGQAGHDVVADFHAHAGGVNGDTLRLEGFAEHTLADAIAAHHVTQVGADVLIADGSGLSVTLSGVNLASLTGSDFLFV